MYLVSGSPIKDLGDDRGSILTYNSPSYGPTFQSYRYLDRLICSIGFFLGFRGGADRFEQGPSEAFDGEQKTGGLANLWPDLSDGQIDRNHPYRKQSG